MNADLSFNLGYALVGLLLIVMTLSSSFIARVPLSSAILYLAVGVGIGPAGLGLLTLDPLDDSHLLERLTEVAVLISLFTVGLKLELPLRDRRWRIPLRLASVSMVLTVGAVTAAGVWLLDLPLGAAVLLGAILAPTDPVLASDVQMSDPHDRDRLRFGLTGEGGLNDGTAFPFVMLGLGLLSLHDPGDWGWRWWAVDVLWAVAGGLGIGYLLGMAVGTAILYLRTHHREALGLDEFMVLGLIALAYGVALIGHTYGFLAVFAAGLALRRVAASPQVPAVAPSPATAPVPSPAPTLQAATVVPPDIHHATRAANVPAGQATVAPAQAPGLGTWPAMVMSDVPAGGSADDGGNRLPDGATDEATVSADGAPASPAAAPRQMMDSVTRFNAQLERVAEVAVVLVIGALVPQVRFGAELLWLVPLLLLVIRPLAVYVGLAGLGSVGVAGSAGMAPQERRLIAWFGIRGIGSMYYLFYAISHGLDVAHAERLVSITLAVVVTSILLHGVTVTPLMRRYTQRTQRSERTQRTEARKGAVHKAGPSRDAD